jgi:signal transduction histidine kinase
MPSPGSPATFGLSQWRRRILERALSIAALLGPIAYLPSLWLSWKEGLWSLVVLDTLVYGWVVLLAFKPAWPYELRAGSVVGLAFLLATALVPLTGIHGAGLPWFAAVPVLAAIFLGLRAGIAVLILAAATLLVLAWGQWIPGAPAGSTARLGWIITACNAVFLGGTLALAVAVLLQGLEDTQLGLVREIDDRQRAEAERGQLEVELRRSQSLEAIGTLASGIAHDVKNVLSPILTLTELAREDIEPGSPAWKRLGDVLDAAERGRDLTERIMAYGRPRTSPRAQVKVAEIVHEVARLLRPCLAAGIRLDLEILANDSRVVADPVELHQVLLNLGTNAIHAMRAPGGDLGIHVFWAEDGRLAIDVVDQGDGMDPATLEQAFHPFFTTKPDGEGTGLGLPMARRIVTGLGGTLELQSAPGKGTRAEIRLPASRA